MKKIYIIAVVIFGVVLFGTILGRIVNPPTPLPEPQQQQKQEQKQISIHIGMTKQAVLDAIGREPNYTSETITANSKLERWQYGSDRVGFKLVILFENERVVAIQRD